MNNSFRYFNSSPEVIRLAVMMYIRYPLSLRQVEDLLFERGIDISRETVRFWWNRFGPMFAAEIRNGGAARQPVGDQANDAGKHVMNETHSAADPTHGAGKLDGIAAQLVRSRLQAPRASAATTTASSASSVPGSRAARQSGRRLKVVWLSGQYQRATRVPGGVMRS